MAVEPFDSLAKDIKQLHSRFFYAKSAFHIFETLRKLKSPPHAGKNQVHINLKTLNHFVNFFQVTEEANRRYFFIELAKFFDKDTRTLSIGSVISKIEANNNNLTLEKFLKYRETIGSPVNVNMDWHYTPPTKTDLAMWKRTLRSIESIRAKLWEYRSQVLVHDDFNKTHLPITGEEIQKLFRVISTLLNKMSSKIDWSSTSHLNTKTSGRDTKLVVEYLTAQKVAQLRKLEHKWELKKYSLNLK